MANKRGRIKRKEGAMTFKLSSAAVLALNTIVRRTLWTKTLAVERSLSFASTHPDFK